MDSSTLGQLLFGILFLVGGADWLVRGASRLAATFGISPVIIGLTFVAYGTSAPELTVSVMASLRGQPDIAVANVVGSNVLNILLILGITTVISPLVVAQRFVRREVPVLIGVSAMFYAVASNGVISPVEGGVLLAGMAAYTIAALRSSRREPAEVSEEYAREFGDAAKPGAKRYGSFVAAGACASGLILLVLGARWLVTAATTIATAIGMSEAVIGLTVIALGTSLPEVATSVLAALRRERDIAVGNVVGSNIFNLLGIGGFSALLSSDGLSVAPSIVAFDIPVMIAVAIACLPILFTGHRIDRWEGFLLLGYYVAYTAYLVLDATGHDLLPAFSGTMLLFVLPLTGLTLAIVTVRAAVERRGRSTGRRRWSRER
ncbi:MAG: calcium/sodium antiporter [Gammaproteobacteria bacterium]|nr:calcium/sodium antiporter [Gammaproteobacteria bacterium]